MLKTFGFRIVRLFSCTQYNRNLDNNEFKLTDEKVGEFQENGVVCLRGVFNKKWRDLAHAGMEKNFANPSEFCDSLPGEDGDEVYFNDYLNWNKIEEIEKYVRESPAAEIAGRLMMSKVRFDLSIHSVIIMIA